MNRAIRIILIVIGVMIISTGLVFAGAWIGQRGGLGYAWSRPWNGMMNGGFGSQPGRLDGSQGYQPGMMGGGYGTGRGMMNGGYGGGPGMMGGNQAYGRGMMGGAQGNSSSSAPLTLDQAFQAATTSLARLNNPDLKIAEVMVFNNNAYVRVIEQSTGIGAFEMLVYPGSQAVSPEPGPGMMWNLKYGGWLRSLMMGGGGMMGYSGSNTLPTVTAVMSISSTQALQAAQQYLDASLPGTTTAPDADAFYGYYTIDILRDGNTVGMLSVNGTSGQVFLHTWHGTFIEAKDY
jgi:hypothetical protein